MLHSIWLTVSSKLMFTQNLLIATCISLHPVPTPSMFSKRSRLESPQDCVEIVLGKVFSTKGWRNTRATLWTRDIRQNWSHVNFLEQRVFQEMTYLQPKPESAKRFSLLFLLITLIYHLSMGYLKSISIFCSRLQNLRSFFHRILSFHRFAGLRTSKKFWHLLSVERARLNQLQFHQRDVSPVIKPDAIFVRTSLSTLKLFLAHKLVKRILFGRNSRVVLRMWFIWFIARNAISNMSAPPQRNLKLDLETTNPP